MAAIRFRFVWLALLAAACDGGAPSVDPSPPAGTAARASADAACERRTFEGTLFTICPFDTRTDRIALAWKGADGRPLRSLAALRQSLGDDVRVRFAMNAGMYDEEGAPIGLFVADGEELKPLNRRRGAGNFHLLPNGVFAVAADGAISVTPASEFRAAMPRPAWATQSGPMLVIDGRLHPKFAPDGESRLIRNGVGAIDRHRGVFAISEEGVSFGRFARLFRDALGCPDALYLDGSVSSLWDPGASREDGHSQLGPMVLVTRR